MTAPIFEFNAKQTIDAIKSLIEKGGEDAFYIGSLKSLHLNQGETYKSSFGISDMETFFHQAEAIYTLGPIVELCKQNDVYISPNFTPRRDGLVLQVSTHFSFGQSNPVMEDLAQLSQAAQFTELIPSRMASIVPGKKLL